MNQWILNVQLVLPVLFPVICGLAVFLLNKKCTATTRNTFVLFALAAEVIITAFSFGGRAQPCQGWGREFESRFPLQKSAEMLT